MHAAPLTLIPAHPSVSMGRNLSEWGGRRHTLLRLSAEFGWSVALGPGGASDISFMLSR